MKIDTELSKHFKNIKIYEDSFEIIFTHSYDGFNIDKYAKILPGNLFESWIKKFGDNVVARPAFSAWILAQDIENPTEYLKI